MNILILTNNIGGLHSFRKEVVKAIVDSGRTVYISAPDEDERATYFEGIGCRVVRTAFNRRGMNPLKDLWLLLTYFRMIKQIRPAAVLTYTVKPNVYGGMACRLTGTPQLANVTGLGDAIENGGWLQRVTLLLYRLGIGRAKRVFFQNSTNREFFIKKGIAREESKLLSGSGVNLEHHSLQPYPADGAIKFLFITRLLKDKGTEEFFAAAEAVKSACPTAEFHILGYCEGDYERRLNELIAAGIVIYHGSTQDVRPYMAAVHCTVMPSYHEGMSNVNLESSANGRPVITTDVPGCRETVDDGVTGFLVKARSAEDLIEKVELFIRLPHEEKKAMGEAARRKMEREFDRQIVVRAYLSAIASIAQLDEVSY